MQQFTCPELINPWTHLSNQKKKERKTYVLPHDTQKVYLIITLYVQCSVQVVLDTVLVSLPTSSSIHKEGRVLVLHLTQQLLSILQYMLHKMASVQHNVHIKTCGLSPPNVAQSAGIYYNVRQI